MAPAFLAIAMVAGAALVGGLAGPVDAVPVAFFGLWGALMIWILDRVPARAAEDADADDADVEDADDAEADAEVDAAARGDDPMSEPGTPAPERKQNAQVSI